MKQREISIELLRILAMLMVLGLHANFIALGGPTAGDILTRDGICRTFFTFFCLEAVNVFVMISGWFGINASIRGFCNFLWRVIYIVGLLWIVGVLFFNEPITIRSILSIVGLYSGGGWFVASYIGLYILSPVLNAYIEKSSPRNIALMLAAFFTFEILWGDTLSVMFIAGGYSTFSFIGIYILAGLLRKVKLKINRRSFYLFLYLVCVIINTLLYIISVHKGASSITRVVYNYINPLVIAASASLLLLFSNKPEFRPMRFRNALVRKIILLTASSCFAAYLLHVGAYYAFTFYREGAKHLYDMFDGFTAFVVLVGYILAVFSAAVIIDQPRKLIWNHIIRPVFKR